MALGEKIEALIERQGRLWEVRQRLAAADEESARRALVHLSEGPWMTVSRQFASGGTDLARRLGERLDWEVYDREILAAIAEHTHSRERILSRLDERAVGHFNDYIQHLLVPGDVGQAGFLKELARVVWALARQGEAILLGRGANWFLSPRFGLRVRVIAPKEVRARRLCETDGMDEATARRRIRENDAGQQAFIRQVFDRDIDDPMGYDLVLNTEALDLDAATEAVHTALRQKLLSQS